MNMWLFRRKKGKLLSCPRALSNLRTGLTPHQPGIGWLGAGGRVADVGEIVRNLVISCQAWRGAQQHSRSDSGRHGCGIHAVEWQQPLCSDKEPSSIPEHLFRPPTRWLVSVSHDGSVCPDLSFRQYTCLGLSLTLSVSLFCLSLLSVSPSQPWLHF